MEKISIKDLENVSGGKSHSRIVDKFGGDGHRYVVLSKGGDVAGNFLTFHAAQKALDSQKDLVNQE